MMRKKRFAVLIIGMMFSVCRIATADTVAGKVIGVADGDTVTILVVTDTAKTPRKIRISGIDAPEKAQAFGAVAKTAMSDMAFGKEAVAECRTVDRYGRSICLVRVGQLDVGLSMIEQGLAWHYEKYANTQPREEAVSYAVLETASRVAKRGLWRDLDTALPPVPPWDWRRAKKAQDE